MSGTEPFPPYNGTPRSGDAHSSSSTKKSNAPRRRKSSGMADELRGDSDVPALATARPALGSSSSLTEHARSPEKPGTRRSKRRTLRRAFSRWKRLCLKHTWLFPLILATTIVSLYLLYPYPSNPISALLFLSYAIPNADPNDTSTPIQYGKGGRDFAFVGFYIIVLSFTREFAMQRIIRPIAIHWGVRSRAKQSRFMEQFYTAMYFSVFGPYGLYVMYRSPVWYFRTRGMYEGFPHRQHEGLLKAYYLLQASYWAQQMIVLLLMLEKPRKDFKELVAHHFITIALIWCSYRFHFMYMGVAVYVTMDVSDFFLASVKVMNYIDSPILGPSYFIFMCVWGYLRHYINLRILYSILTEFSTIGPFELNWTTQQYKCWISQYITFALLSALQAVNLIWWYYVCRIAYRFAWLNVAKDERSDDESDGEGEEGEKREREREQEKGVNGSANGTPKVLVNGVEQPETPKRGGVANGGLEEPGSISSRLRERKSKK